MTIYVDIVSRKIISSPRLKRDISRIEVKRGDLIPFSIIFIQNGEPVSLGANHSVTLGAKLKNNNEGVAMVLTSFTQAGGAIPYTANVSFNGSDLSTYLNNEVNVIDDYTFVDLQMEINWINSVTFLNKTTNSTILRVYNDVIKGGEIPPVINNGVPFEFPDGLKTNEISELTVGSGVLVSSTLIASHIHGNLAGSVYSHIRAGEALVKGDPVYVSGYHSGTNVPIVSKADASNAAKMPAVGIMDAAVANNGSGHMVIIGTITDINTAAYAVNAELYVAASGGLTATAPSDRAQPVARVERSNTNNGAIIVTIGVLSATNATANTFVRRNSSGRSSFTDIVLSGTGGSPYTTTLTGGINFANRTLSFPDRDGMLVTASDLANSASITASTTNVDNTIVLRDSAGQVTFGGLNISGTTAYGSATNWTYAGSTAATHRTALGLTTLATTTPATNVATFLATPSSANLAAAVTGETGTGALVFGTSPTIDAPTISGSAAFTSTTRPTSAGTGTPAATSLMTRDDVALEPFYSLGSIFRVSATPAFATSGTGSAASQVAGDRWIALSSGTANSGWARAQFGRGITTPPSLSGSGINFASKLGVSIVLWLGNSVATDNLTIFRLRFGSDNTPVADGVDAVSYRGFGIEIKARGTSHDWRVYGHNGTSITYSAWSNTGLATNTLQSRIYLSAMSNGAGSITASIGINGSRTLGTITTTGGPTTGGTSTQALVECHVANSASGTSTLSAALYDAIFYAQS